MFCILSDTINSFTDLVELRSAKQLTWSRIWDFVSDVGQLKWILSTSSGYLYLLRRCNCYITSEEINMRSLAPSVPETERKRIASLSTEYELNVFKDVSCKISKTATLSVVKKCVEYIDIFKCLISDFKCRIRLEYAQ